VYVTRLLQEEVMNRINSFCDVEAWLENCPAPRGLLLEKVTDKEGLLTMFTDRVDSELMDIAPKLTVVSNLGVGFDNIDVTEATRRGIIVANTPGVLTETTADFAFALILAAARRVVEGAELVRKGNWKTWDPSMLLGQDVHGATLGIIGLGRIGSAVARRARGFGMRVLYYDVNRQRRIENELGVDYAGLDKVLSQSDFVSVHANLNSETYHLIGTKELSRMKKNAVLVNTSRGPLVDNMALFEVLKDGKIAFAALDVTEPEPIPAGHPLLSLDNILITPHLGSASNATRTKMSQMAADNLIAVLKGETPASVVNPEAMKNRVSRP
jgi:glyoxylate reductase